MTKAVGCALLLILVGFLAYAPLSVEAQESTIASQQVSDVQNKEGALGAIRTIFNFIFVILLAVSGFVLLFAAWQFVVAGGEPMAVGAARQKLMYAIVGIIIAFFSFSVPRLIANALPGGEEVATEQPSGGTGNGGDGGAGNGDAGAGDGGEGDGGAGTGDGGTGAGTGGDGPTPDEEEEKKDDPCATPEDDKEDTGTKPKELTTDPSSCFVLTMNTNNPRESVTVLAEGGTIIEFAITGFAFECDSGSLVCANGEFPVAAQGQSTFFLTFNAVKCQTIRELAGEEPTGLCTGELRLETADGTHAATFPLEGFAQP